jgi:topoisomerase-4 subunit A
VLKLEFVKPKGKPVPEAQEINAEEFISVKGYSALGNQLGSKKIKKVSLAESLPYEVPTPEPLENIDVEVEDEDDDSQIKLDF